MVVTQPTSIHDPLIQNKKIWIFIQNFHTLSKKILIRLNVKVQNTRKCWTKIWFTHFCFSPKLKAARIKNSYLVFKRKSLELKWRWTTYVNACCRQFTSKPINFQNFSHLYNVLELSLQIGFILAFPKCFRFNQTEEMDILIFLSSNWRIIKFLRRQFVERSQN